MMAYQQSWSNEFDTERMLLKDALGIIALDVQHIGSTAVPGLAAKPIIDIAIAVTSLMEVGQLIEPLRRLGYEDKGEAGVPDRRFFAKGPENSRTHYLHISPRGTEFSRLIKFRDVLRQRPELRKRYGRLKETLAGEFAEDRASYTSGKNTFIESVIEP